MSTYVGNSISNGILLSLTYEISLKWALCLNHILYVQCSD